MHKFSFVGVYVVLIQNFDYESTNPPLTSELVNNITFTSSEALQILARRDEKYYHYSTSMCLVGKDSSQIKILIRQQLEHALN